MPYKLSGVLKSPNGQPLTGVDIQFIAQQTQSPVLQQTDHNIRLGLDGAYNVTLENNTYAVKAQINGLGPQHMGYILISSDTPAGLDLPQLLRSYSQQSTAPDYAQLIEKWLAEAKAAADTSTAQAASAKSQADRAKSEADRASQISGLDTVADAIGLAAVPFPDVWIPLNDSLRMFAGYGREVKVGDDVVARMVNFERSTTATYIDKSGVLRTAAINEPRFEKQGLLIEGQSTNLFTKSSGVGFWAGSGSDDIIESSEVNPYGVIGDVLSIVSKAPTNLYKSVTAKPSTTYTFSIFFRVKPGTKSCSVKWGFESGGILGGPARVEIDCLTLALISRDNGVLRYEISRLSYGWCRFDVSARTAESPTNVTLNISEGAGNAENTLMIFGWQLEELPFASSYIPTNGTAVTRAADKVTITRLNNDCAEWYSGADKITPIITSDKIQLIPPASKYHLRNVKGFFTPLTETQKKALK